MIGDVLSQPCEDCHTILLDMPVGLRLMCGPGQTFDLCVSEYGGEKLADESQTVVS